MNWKEIQKKYPKAWGLFRQSDYYGLQHQNARIFYDFFDEQEIRIAIYIDRKHYGYSFSNIEGNIFSIDSEAAFNTRTEAETKAFEKAFFILEEKLNR